MQTPCPPGWRTLGHDSVSRYLQRSVATGRLAHAYLITGSAQVGKACLAIDLARAVNCRAGGAGEGSARPCGECGTCDRVLRGAHPDVMLIDEHTPITGATGEQPSTPEQDARRTMIGIHHIREMQHQAALNSFEGGWRVFIFDGVEHMSPEAPDALLKTLEEPPGRVLIVLLAQSTQGIPETIASRCQRLELRTVPAEVIERGLVERAGVGPERAALLAKLAEGRPGWAFNAAADETTLDRYRQGVLRIVGVITGDLEDRFRYARDMAAEFQRDRATVIRELQLWRSLWRDVLHIGHGLTAWVVNSEHESGLSAIARQAPPEAARSALLAIEATARALTRNSQPRLALEVMMLDLPAVSGDGLPEGFARPSDVSGGQGEE